MLRRDSQAICPSLGRAVGDMRTTHALAMPDKLSPSGPRSPIDKPSSLSSLMNGTLSFAGKLLKLMITFAFAKEKGTGKRGHGRDHGN